MAKLQVDVVLVGSDAATFSDLDGHAARDDISRREVLSGWGIAFHETLSFRVQKISALTAGTYGIEITFGNRRDTESANLP
jgi:hypothetical protein